MGDISKKNVIGNFIWRFAERCGAQLVTFVVSIVLARLWNSGFGYSVYNNFASVC